MRRLLAAAEPMNVDELLVLTQALDLSPKDFGLAEGVVLPDEIDDEDAVPVAVDGDDTGVAVVSSDGRILGEALATQVPPEPPHPIPFARF